MFNIGPLELMVILLLALVVVGPSKLPEVGRSIGRALREFRKVQDEVRDMVDTGMGEDFKQTTAELRKTAADLRGATDVTSAFRNAPHKARQRAAEAVRAATTPDDDPAPELEGNTAAVAEPSPATPTSEPTLTPEPTPSSNGSDPAADPPPEPTV
jgi:TatA/E family protein of Tat protein translocase